MAKPQKTIYNLHSTKLSQFSALPLLANAPLIPKIFNVFSFASRPSVPLPLLLVKTIL